MKTKYASCAMLACIASAAALGNNSRSTNQSQDFSQYHTFAWGSNNANPIHNSIPASALSYAVSWSIADLDVRHYLISDNHIFGFETEEEQMIKLSRVSRIVLLVSPFALTSVTGTYAQDQHPLLDKVAAKVIQKYETTPCQELMQKKANPQPPTAEEVKAVQFLKTNPEMRTLFINKVAAPIANKISHAG